MVLYVENDGQICNIDVQLIVERNALGTYIQVLWAHAH
jgi:alpha-galactosidase/6-phospho-beta-glucosidase family protein